jgi:hypothetical protein
MSKRALVARPKEGRVVRFLVELDAIQDTRLGLMDLLDPEAAVRLVANPDYFTRVIDKFEPLCGMDDDIFQEAWKKRTKEVLKHSINTLVLDMIHYQVVEVEYRSVDDPTLAGALVDVNIYPYQLDRDEQTGLLMALAQRIGTQAQIRLVNQPPRYYTPALVKQEYYAMVLYNHNEWFAAHQAELFSDMGVKMPGVTLYAPQLVRSEMPPAELQDFTKHGFRKDVGVFDVMARGMAGLVGLEYLPINQYCIAFPGVNGIPKVDPSLIPKLKESEVTQVPLDEFLKPLPKEILEAEIQEVSYPATVVYPEDHEPDATLNAAKGSESEDIPL